MRPVQIVRNPRCAPALVVGALGCVNLALGIAAPRLAPLVCGPLMPLGKPLVAIICGAVLLQLAMGMARGLRAAWLGAMALLIQAAFAVPSTHNERLLLLLPVLAALWLYRNAFTAPARLSWRGTAGLVAGCALLLLAGATLHRLHLGPVYDTSIHVVHAADTEERVAVDAGARVMVMHPAMTILRGDWRTVLLESSGLLAVLISLQAFALPKLPRREASDEEKRAIARRLFETYGANGVGYFAAGEDKTIWLDPRGRGAVAFRVVGATALVAGDPIAAPDDLPAVLDGFLAQCRAHGWTAAFYQTLDSTLSLYRRHGFRALAIGREAIIDLPSFTLAGKRIANVRHSVTHAERAGLSVHVFKPGELDDATRAGIVAISREWLAAKGGGEMGFTMGQLTDTGEPLPGSRVAVARDAGGTIQAFITVVPSGSGRGWTLDLMRRASTAVSGAMDLLIARTAEALRDEGYRTLSLSLAPMVSGEDDDEDAPMPARRARQLLYEHMDGAYNYRSLFNYKKKFNVRWETRYLVYAGDAALPAALYATARVHLPSTLISLPRLSNVRPLWERAAGRLVAGAGRA